MSPTIGGALKIARTTLRTFLQESEADREARLLLGHATGRSQASLLADLGGKLDGDAHKRLKEGLVARQKRQPLSQIFGEVEFYGRRIEVSGDVLTPRPDTETLIDIALSAPFDRVLDLGTGSGCILATLLAERGGATGLGTDLSKDALLVAARNLDALGVASRAELRPSDWFGGVDGDFDLIVSNPPYISTAEMARLAPEVHDWEPHIALTPGGDGLSCYRAISKAAQSYLKRDGRLLVEIGYEQGPAVYALFEDAGFDQVRVHTDINGRDRVVEGRMPQFG